MSALTKIFIVLQLVCSLVAAVILVVGVKGQANYKQNADLDHANMVAAQSALVKKTGDVEAANSRIAQLNQDVHNAAGEAERKLAAQQQRAVAAEIARDEAVAKITAAENKVSSLTAAQQSLSDEIVRLNQEMKRMSPENARLIQQNAELNRANNEATTALHFAEQTIRKLQEELAAAPKAGAVGPAESGAVASLSIQPPALINGKVTEAKQLAGRTLIEVPLGTRDGVTTNTKFIISRNGSYIADATVEKLTPDSSVLATDPAKTKKGEAVKAGDIVTSGNAQ